MSDDTLDMFADTDPHKLARTNDPDTSKAAAKRVKSGKMKEFVWEQVRDAGEHGLTGKELCDLHRDMSRSTLTSRPAELEEDDLIFYRGDKRDYCRVMRVVEFRKFPKGHCQKCGGFLLSVYEGECKSPKCENQ